MAELAQAPQQHRQPSRKGRKAWRKNVDISEVQQGLEDVRDEVLRGGVVAEKPSEDLFALDTTGSAAIQKAYNKDHKPLRAEEILAQRSAIPAVDSRKRKVTDGVLETVNKRRRNAPSNQQIAHLRAIASGREALPRNIVNGESVPSHDPWAVVDEPAVDPRFSYIPSTQPIREPKTLKAPPVSLAVTADKVYPAVSKPQAGRSYNPSFEAWDALIQKEGKKEVNAERQRLAEAEAERIRQERITEIMNQPDPEEAEEESAWESEWEGIQSEPEESYLRAKRPERKTPQQRKKVEKRKEAERTAKKEAGERKRRAQEQRITALKREVDAKEKARLSLSKALVTRSMSGNISSDADDDLDEGESILRRRKFGKAQIPPAPLELVLADELQDSLRQLRPEGNLLRDRYRNMLMRGLVETRNKIGQQKKVRRELLHKWSYKDWELR